MSSGDAVRRFPLPAAASLLVSVAAAGMVLFGPVSMSTLMLAAPSGGAESGPVRLSFEERVAAHQAIARVSYSHLIGSAGPFEKAVPRSAIEAEVRRTLGQSAALAKFWNSPIDAVSLRNEMTRIVQGTRMPDRLREIVAALGDDSVLLQECLARRTLADTRARALFAFDGRIHSGARAAAEALHDRLASGRLSLSADEPRRTVTELRLIPTGNPPAFGQETLFFDRDRSVQNLDGEAFATWRQRAPGRIGEIGPVVEEAESFLIRAVMEEETDRVVLVTYVIPKRTWDDWWSEVGPRFEAMRVPAVAVPARVSTPVPAAANQTGSETLLPSFGSRIPGPSHAATNQTGNVTLPPTPPDSWSNGALGQVPDGREGATAVWTGSRLVVWGGTRDGRYLQSGSRYDPATDSWSPTTPLSAPSARWGHTAVWTGSRMIVWGGTNGINELDTGARYDPVGDSWTALAMMNAPQSRSNHAAVWTGNRLVVWGGVHSGVTGSVFLDTGGLYDPEGNSWSPTAVTGAPQGRQNPAAVWTGSRMIVWGGRISTATDLVNTGGVYDPGANAWTPTSTNQAPSPRESHTAVWDGSRLLVWGGHDYVGYSPRPLGTGGRYDPVANTWSTLSMDGAPLPRHRHTAVWTGSLMIVWGGDAAGSFFGSGGRYDPATDVWTTVMPIGAPQGRSSHVAVWSGTEMIVWGGSTSGSLALSSGGRYNPAQDQWTPTIFPNAPTPREGPTSVWTGSLWIVWGGTYLDQTFNSGGRYDPATDSWTPTSLAGAPRGRVHHTAVWTGDRMIVWGGEPCPYLTDKGARYDPVSDAWQLIDSTTEPSPRRHHTALWTGSRMIVWGGLTCESTTSVTSTGASYDPGTNQWVATSIVDAPSPREHHTAVWTGSRMIVWGGGDAAEPEPGDFDSGGSYDPVQNAWTGISKGSSPAARRHHTAVWTGDTMIVWGGTGTEDFSSGGRYSPATNRWEATSTRGAPSPRTGHTAVWTGNLMVVWGGEPSAPGLDALRTGGRYDPVANTWTPVTLIGAPTSRHDHTAAWTGAFMLVFGGTGDYTVDSGGRYIPSTP